MKRFFSVLIAIILWQSEALHAQYLPPDTLWTEVFTLDVKDYVEDLVLSEAEGYLLAGSSGPVMVDLSAALLMVDSSGNELWHKTYRDSASIYSYFYSVLQHPNGGYIASGCSLFPDSTGENAWLVKLDESGNIQWENTIFSPNQDSFFYMSIPVSGGDFLHVGGIGVYTQNTLDMLILRTDTGGSVESLHQYGGDQNDSGFDAVETSAHDIVAVGKTRHGSLTSGYIIKVDSAGTVLWEELYSSGTHTCLECVSLLNDGGIVVGGFSTETGSVLAEYDQDGILQWDESYESVSSIRDLEVCPNGDIVCVGSAENGGVLLMRCGESGGVIWQTELEGGSGYALISDLNGGYAVAAGINDYPEMDLWLLQFASCSGMEETHDAGFGEIQASVSPNPFRGAVTLEYNIEVRSDIDVSVYDCSGRRIDFFELQNRPSGRGYTSWTPGPEVPDGLYSIVLSTGSEKATCRCLRLK